MAGARLRARAVCSPVVVSLLIFAVALLFTVRLPSAVTLFRWSTRPTSPPYKFKDYVATPSASRNWAGAARAPGGTNWTDDLLYTPAGMAFDAHRLMPTAMLAVLTGPAQGALAAHQFPSSCAGKRFVVSHANGPSPGVGLGSHVHVAGAHFAFAVEDDRIFLWSDGAMREFTDPVTCNGELSALCFFRPPSNCSLDDADAPGVDTVHLHDGASLLALGAPNDLIPRAFHAMFEALALPIRGVRRAGELKYWWRAQSVAFLMRFSDYATGILHELRTSEGMVQHAPVQSSNAWGARMAASLPFPRGMVSLHVRHGDKGSEMQLVDTHKYVAAAEEIVVNGPMAHVRAAFVSTEDPGVIDTVREAPLDWTFAWYDVPRINSNGAHPRPRRPPHPHLVPAALDGPRV